MSLNTVKYKGELLAEDERISTDTPGVLGEYKELRADALEADTLDITVLSESGTIRSFKKNDKVEYFRSGSRVGVYYLQNVTRVGPKLYTLSALSAVGLLIVRPHRGGIYTGQTVAEVVAEICGDIPVLIETVYRGIKLYGWLPIASARDSLVQVLFAIGAWLHTDEDGTLRVQKLWNGTASIIGPGSVHAANIQVKYLDPVSAVAVTEHQYIAGTEDVTLFEGTAQQGDVIEFDKPAHTLTAKGFTILESGANYAVLSAGTGKLTGKSYVHNRRVVTRTVTEGAAENVEEIADATLVSLVNSSAVAQRMAAYYACREQLTVDVNPAAEHAGHVVLLWNEWDKQQTLACIASRETKISGLLKSRTSALVGFLPPQPESSEYYDERVLLTGSGEWTVPEGITEVRAVLIGGGENGANGSSGSSSIVVSKELNPNISPASASFQGTSAQPGGSGGAGGSGGKVLDQTIDVTQLSSISYACGSSIENGADVSETVFGALTTADGASSVAGFTDPITLETYAKRGTDGSAGAKGGNVGSMGESSGDVPGGRAVSGASATPTQSGTGYSLNTGEKYYTYTCSATVSNQGAGGGGAGGAGGSGAKGSQGGSAYNYRPSLLGYCGQGNNTALPHFYANVRFADAGFGGKGGNGGNALTYGSGGGGGGGGGGAGAIGNASINASVSISSLDGNTHTPQFTMLNNMGGAWIDGGSGGGGGQGGDGCIILYYRKFGQRQAGPLVQRGGGLFFDRLNKLFIV
nr:MAG TPA: neurotoxin [Caudoviricetes sp.]